VVINPGWGDAVQAAKAGLLEVADVFVINKADRPGVEEASRDLQHMLDLSAEDGGGAWRPPIVPAVASKGEGTDQVLEAICSHRAWLEADGRLEAKRARRAGEELRSILVERLAARVQDAYRGEAFDAAAAAVLAREVDPWTATDALVDALGQ
jgi:LAO/AO transport system kinase